MKEKYYLTTAIAYASGKPHIGNTYEIIMADAIARYKRMNTSSKKKFRWRYKDDVKESDENTDSFFMT